MKTGCHCATCKDEVTEWLVNFIKKGSLLYRYLQQEIHGVYKPDKPSPLQDRTWILQSSTERK